MKVREIKNDDRLGKKLGRFCKMSPSSDSGYENDMYLYISTMKSGN